VPDEMLRNYESGESRFACQRINVPFGMVCWCRKLHIGRKPASFWLTIGISAPGIRPDSYGTTSDNATSYCMGSHGAVTAAGQRIVYSHAKLPASSIIKPDLFAQRGQWDKVFTAGDDVVVVLDCSAHTLKLQSPTVQHVISIKQQHHKQQWVLNVNFSEGDHQIELL